MSYAFSIDDDMMSLSLFTVTDYIVDDLMLEWKGQGRYDPPAAKLAESQ